MGAATRALVPAACYAGPALALGWLVGGQAALGRVDASLAVPLLMPGALLWARFARNQTSPLSLSAGAAILLLFAAQWALHLHFAGRAGFDHLLLTALAGAFALSAAWTAARWTRAWRRRARWPVLALAIAGWFALGQGLLALVHADRAAGPRPSAVMLTSLPLRWAGGGGDLAAMLAAGPADLPALTALEKAVDLHVVDTLEDGVPPGAALFLAHPRALPPAELVRIDAHLRGGGTAVILADALSSWPPVHALGDSRNPPVTSLLTPLLDHWGVELAAPDDAQAGDASLFLGPGGPMLRLHSAGRFVRRPGTCRTLGDARALRCAIGQGTAWIVGDADLLHAEMWQSPVAWAPWLRRSDNMAWLAGRLKGREAGRLQPLWIQSRGR